MAGEIRRDGGGSGLRDPRFEVRRRAARFQAERSKGIASEDIDAEDAQVFSGLSGRVTTPSTWPVAARMPGCLASIGQSVSSMSPRTSSCALPETRSIPAAKDRLALWLAI